MDTANQKNNEKGRRKLRFSVMDIVILLLVLAAVAGGVYRVVYAIEAERNQVEGPMYAVTFRIEDIHADTLQDIEGFDAVYLYDSGVRIGHIAMEKYDETDANRIALNTVEVFNKDGQTRVAAVGRMICTDAELRDGGLLVEGSEQYLMPGSELRVRTDRVVMTIRITEIVAHS
jgi:flagellar basal body-associated protein FliL